MVGFLVCEILIQWRLHPRKDPCYYEYIKNLRNDKNASTRFAYCVNRSIETTRYNLKGYFRYLPRDINFTADEQKIVDKARKILNDEFDDNKTD